MRESDSEGAMLVFVAWFIKDVTNDNVDDCKWDSSSPKNKQAFPRFWCVFNEQSMSDMVSDSLIGLAPKYHLGAAKKQYFRRVVSEKSSYLISHSSWILPLEN